MKLAAASAAAFPFSDCAQASKTDPPPPPGETGTPIFGVSQIPSQAVTGANHHVGVDALLDVMGRNGLKFFRTSTTGVENGTNGLIAADDIILLKVNAQWKYRGCTNSDLVRGLIRRILDHPDGFHGEIIIIENGQGRGSLACDTPSPYGNSEVHANAENDQHSFLWLINNLFQDTRVSAYLLDPIRDTFIGDADHQTAGYRLLEDVSYPCFTTPGGRRVELSQGIWNGSSFEQRLKLINIPVLKHHDRGGSEFTGALKHMYGMLSMSDGQWALRHYETMGETCGKMMVLVHTPVLNIMDAIWVSHGALEGTPVEATTRMNQVVASQDPVALDYWAAQHILYPIDNNVYHRPDFPGIEAWLSSAMATINGQGGFSGKSRGILVEKVTKTESEMRLYQTTP